jgi:hypothetical protein
MTDNALKTPLFQSLVNVSDRRANNFQQTAAQSIPCHVTKIDKDFTTVAFEPQNSIWTLPTIKLPQSFSRYVREPTQVGDQGYAVPSNYNTETLTGLGGSYTNFYPKGNLTPLSFQPFSRTSNEDRDYDQLTLTGGPNGIKIIQSSQKPKEDPPPGGSNPIYQRRLRNMGARSRHAWLKARQRVPLQESAPLEGEVLAPLAALIPKTTINVDQLGNLAVNAIKGIAHVSDNLMPLSSMPQVLQGITHMSGTGIAHIADAALGAQLPSQVQGILHLAQQAITSTSMQGDVTHSALQGLLNLVVKKQLNIGAPSQTYQYDATTPPQPTQPTLVNIIGSLMSSANMSAGGNISAGGAISAESMTCGGWSVPTGAQNVTDPIPQKLLAALVALNMITDNSTGHWAPKVVNGAKAGNAALASLIAALVQQGLVIDSTSA